MSRTFAVIERQIAEIQAQNQDWMTNPVDKALITALLNEKNQLAANAAAAGAATTAAATAAGTAGTAGAGAASAASGTNSNKRLTDVLERQTKTMSAILEFLEEIGDKDCYDRISQSSKPRALSKSNYYQSYNVPSSDLPCMITGYSPNSLGPNSNNFVILAHLLPRNASVQEQLSLDYNRDDIENIRNSIILCKGIEEAFDHKFISFVPADKPFSSNRYKMHIWVAATRRAPIYPGATELIGQYEGADLKLTVGAFEHNPFKRALSYQAFRAFKTFGKDLGLEGLPEDCDTSVYKGTYKLQRAAFAERLAKDIDADADDAEED